MFVVAPLTLPCATFIYTHEEERGGTCSLFRFQSHARATTITVYILHSLERHPCYKYTSDQEGKGHG